MRVVIEHPQGHGLGNAGVVAKRTGVEIKAGESTYTELGVDAGVAGVLAFVLWSIAILVGLVAPRGVARSRPSRPCSCSGSRRT